MHKDLIMMTAFVVDFSLGGSPQSRPSFDRR